MKYVIKKSKEEERGGEYKLRKMALSPTLLNT